MILYGTSLSLCTNPFSVLSNNPEKPLIRTIPRGQPQGHYLVAYPIVYILAPKIRAVSLQ